jgi:hypothetical protein
LPRVINLLTDRKEERDVAAYNSWVADPALKIIGGLEESFKTYPPIELGTPTPTCRHRGEFSRIHIIPMAWRIHDEGCPKNSKDLIA